VPRVVAHREIVDPGAIDWQGVDSSEIAHIRPILEDMLKQFDEPVVALATSGSEFTTVSIQRRKKDERDTSTMTQQLSIIDWCNRYHSPKSTVKDLDFSSLRDSKVVPAQIVLRFTNRSAASVPEHVYNARAPATLKRATGRIRVVNDDDDDDDVDGDNDDSGRRRSRPPTETKRRAYRPPK
jgi:hypothetical protein